MYVFLLALAHQVTTNGLIFTIFGVFEAHVSIHHLPNDDYNTDGFVAKKSGPQILCSQNCIHYIMYFCDLFNK